MIMTQIPEKTIMFPIRIDIDMEKLLMLISTNLVINHNNSPSNFMPKIYKRKVYRNTNHSHGLYNKKRR